MVDQCKAELKSLDSTKIIRNTQRNTIKERPKEKEFITRNSILTDLGEIEHFKTIYHIIVAFTILLLTSVLFREYNGFNKSTHNFSLIKWNFGNLDVALAVWMTMQFGSLVILYNGFKFWANYKHNHGKIWDYFWLSSYLVYLVAFFYYPAQSVIVNKLPPASSTIVIAEQIRGIMKTHGFVRSNAGKVFELTRSKGHGYETPAFSSYLYYYFAPTLIYRDEYPRTLNIRWKFVVSYFLQFSASIFFSYFIIEYFISSFENFGKEPINVLKYVDATLNIVVLATLYVICISHSMFHSWPNMFAEMLRFGDRQFYMDWWNCTSYAGFFRKWSLVIHEYLFAYVYKDIRKITSSKIAAALLVFTLSSLIHEYMLTLALGFFFPVVLIMFGFFGSALALIPTSEDRDFQNIFVWLTFGLGNAIFISLYSMEWFARKNCPPYPDSTLDFVIPRIWVCYQTQLV